MPFLIPAIAIAEISPGVELPSHEDYPRAEAPTEKECETMWAYYFGMHQPRLLWCTLDTAFSIGDLDLVWALETIELNFELYDTYAETSRHDGLIEVADVIAGEAEATRRLVLCPHGINPPPRLGGRPYGPRVI